MISCAQRAQKRLRPDSFVPDLRQNKDRFDILANAVEERLASCNKPIKVAVMGCAVNGPGEAREADIGIAGGDGCALIFKRVR